MWDERKGEMVYYIFDGLMFNAKNICSMDLNGRLQVIQNDIISPLERRDKSEGKKTVYEAAFPFKMKMKQMWKPYGLQELFERVIPAQGHENDGLIFTPVKDAYMAGTCHRLLKWKPSEMNSIDFLIRIKEKKAEAKDSGTEGELWIASQGRCHYYCDFDPKLDETLQSTDIRSLDDKIAEFRLNPNHPNKWTFMRFRPDKRLPNDSKTVEKVIQSIKDNVRREDLLEREGRIRANWKAREKTTSGGVNGNANSHVNNTPQTQTRTHINQPILVPRSQRIKPPVSFKYPLNLRTEAAKKAYKEADGWLEYNESSKLVELAELAESDEESNAERNRESDRQVYCKSEDLCYELEADEEEEKAPRKRIKTDME